MGIDPTELARRTYNPPTRFSGWQNYGVKPIGTSLGSGDVKVNGLKELHAELQRFSVKFEKNVMRGALRAGIKEIEKIAKDKMTDVAHADLRTSLRVSTRVRRGNATATLTVGGGKAWYAKFVEFGTATKYTGSGKTVGAKYAIKPKRKKFLRYSRGGITIFSRGVMHPGASSHPFMRPAFDEGSAKAITAVRNYIRQRLDKTGGFDPT